MTPEMPVTRFLSCGAALLSRPGYLQWLLLFSIAISVAKAGDWPEGADDLSMVEITLQRSTCLGSCPDYKVTIHGDGRVVFTAKTAFHAMSGDSTVMPDGVVWPGTHEDRIAPKTVAALLEQFREADFFNLLDSYAHGGYHPTYVLTVDTGRRRKSIEDYAGRLAGMPEAVRELERAVDTAAGTERWVSGAGLITWLEARNFDFHSTEAAELAVRGANGWAGEAMILALIDRGAPLDSDGEPPETVKQIRGKFPHYTPPPTGVSLMEGAIRRGMVTLFNRLAAAGWLDRLGKDKAAQAFAYSGAGCSPALVDAAADAGIAIDAGTGDPGPILHMDGVTTLFPSIDVGWQGDTALTNLGSSLCQGGEADRVATAERLLARGADPNHRNNRGYAPLDSTTKPDMVNLLLAHGAERR
jgi:hypothetical protein